MADEKRRASACFAHIAYPNPPPPPKQRIADRVDAASLRKQRERLGDLEAYAAPRKTDTAQWDEDMEGAIEGTGAILDALGEQNPILQGLLRSAKDEIVTASGRRLMQRLEYNVRMTDALVTHEIMATYGAGGIPGLTAASCEALCEALTQIENSQRSEICASYGFKRAAPFSYVDKTGWCFLLQNAGACKVEDFGVELYTRQIESERQCSATAPGLDSKKCNLNKRAP